MEVIARKKEGLLALYIGLAVVFAIIFFGLDATIFIADSAGNPMAYLTLFFGVVCVGIFLWVIVRIARTPSVAIVYDQGKIRFANGFVCNPQDITSVNYHRSHARGISYRWGGLTVTVGTQVFKYNFIADVEAAHNRLLQLMLEAREKNNG